MAAGLFHSPLPRIHTPTHYGGPDESAASVATGSAVANLNDDLGAPWESAAVTAAGGRVLSKYDSEAQAGGLALRWRNPTGRAVLGVTAGRTAAANTVQLNGTSQKIEASHAGLATSATMTLAAVVRMRTETPLNLPAAGILASLTKSTGTGASNTDADIRVGTDGLLKSQVYRVGAALTILTSTQRVDDGRWYGVAVTIDSGNTGSLYYRTESAATVLADSDTVAAHSPTSSMRLLCGLLGAATWFSMEFAGAWYFSTDLTAAELDEVFENPASVYARDDLIADWFAEPAEAGTTTIVDPVGAFDATVPNSWSVTRWPFAPVIYSRPYFGSNDRRQVLQCSGHSGSRAQTAATLTLTPRVSAIFGFRVPTAADLNQSNPFFELTNGGAARDFYAQISASKLLVNAKRISGAAVSGSSSSTLTAGTFYAAQISLDPVDSTALVYIDGTLEATISSLPAFVASTVAFLRIGGTAGTEARVDIMGGVYIVAGLPDPTTALDWFRNGRIPDERIIHYYPLDGTGTDYGSDAKNLTFTATSFLRDVQVPGTHIMPRSRRLRQTGAKVVDFSAESTVGEVYLELYDPQNGDTGFVVDYALPMAREAIHENANGWNLTHGKMALPVWLTREQLSRIKELAGDRVALAARIVDDGVGERVESVRGKLTNLTASSLYTVQEGTTRHWSGILEIEET